MAKKSYGCSLTGAISPVTDTLAAITTIDTDLDAAIAEFVAKTAVDTAIGVLDADGAAPTEAHVDDLVAAWATFEAGYDAGLAALTAVAALTQIMKAGTGGLTQDAVFSVTSTATMNEILVVLRAFEAQLRSTV